MPAGNDDNTPIEDKYPKLTWFGVGIASTGTALGAAWAASKLAGALGNSASQQGAKLAGGRSKLPGF